LKIGNGHHFFLKESTFIFFIFRFDLDLFISNQAFAFFSCIPSQTIALFLHVWFSAKLHHKVIANFHCQPDSDQPNCPDPNILIYSLQSNRTKMASDDSHLKNLEQWIVEEKKIVRLRRTENAHTDRPHRVPYPSNASFFSSFPFR
jgi:hypothetical protein